ncbi:MAG: TetR family transcriptional regulator [Aeromicrobium sp.]|jgi:AcrR family transcriptional regulator|nr:TetR family transcriptional regulator [Aeromicrobium sp.]
MSMTEERPQRADARRNREAILRAARHIFAKDGSQAQMDDVAKRAKVGVGTVYRHFPTKEALFEALAVDKFDRLARFADEAMEIEDPWDSVVTFLKQAAAMHASDRALSEVFRDHGDFMVGTAQDCGLTDLGDRLVQRAQAAGVLRKDIRGSDLGMICCSLGDLGAVPVWSWERMLDIVLDGLRPDGTQSELSA